MSVIAGRPGADEPVPSAVATWAAGRPLLPVWRNVDDRWIADPEIAVRAIGVGLRALHDGLPPEKCPFTWSQEERFDRVLRRAATGRLTDPAGWDLLDRPMSLSAALDLLGAAPPIDQLVVCHGDACAPNTLIDSTGQWSAHVDLGALGIADRWADLAVATWSTQWNYGTGWEGLLLDAYGVQPDPERTTYYRLLWDLG